MLQFYIATSYVSINCCQQRYCALYKVYGKFVKFAVTFYAKTILLQPLFYFVVGNLEAFVVVFTKYRPN